MISMCSLRLLTLSDFQAFTGNLRSAVSAYLISSMTNLMTALPHIVYMLPVLKGLSRRSTSIQHWLITLNYSKILNFMLQTIMNLPRKLMYKKNRPNPITRDHCSFSMSFVKKCWNTRHDQTCDLLLPSLLLFSNLRWYSRDCLWRLYFRDEE